MVKPAHRNMSLQGYFELFISIRGLTFLGFRASLEPVSHQNKNVQQLSNEALEGADLHYGGIRRRSI